MGSNQNINRKNGDTVTAKSTGSVTEPAEISDGVALIVGTDEPVHRSNNLHPLTGQPDMARGSVGNRRRIEQLEFKVGHVICGHRSTLTGEYCLNPPVDGTMRCENHSAVSVFTRQKSPRYSLVEQVFQRCSLCRVLSCDYRNMQSGGSECVLERDLYETLMEEAKNFSNYGEATQHLFEQLVWVRVLLFRAYSQLAAEGLTVTEVTGFSTQGDSITPIMNDREHPVLKHLARLQQVDKQLCDALELTPSAKTKKGEADKSAQTQDAFSDLIKKAFQRFESSSGAAAESTIDGE